MSVESVRTLFAPGPDGRPPRRSLDELPAPFSRVSGRRRGEGWRGESYRISEALALSTDVALILGQPLLLTGSPGVGKTRYAYALAARLRLPPPEVVNVKSTTTGRELLYAFDDVGRFRDASSGERKPLLHYVRLSGLGRAIVRACGADTSIRVGGTSSADILGPEYRGLTSVPVRQLFPEVFEELDWSSPNPGAGSTRSLVLIDEIDKAPRDTPNDLLFEIEAMSFCITELDLAFEAPAARWPIVIVTSNSERALPEPFLRRCVFHHIEDPRGAELQAIIATHLVEELRGEEELLASALSLFGRIGALTLEKAPATAELLAWMTYLVRCGLHPGTTLDYQNERHVEVLRASVGVLAKSDLDRERVMGVVDAWSLQG